MIFNINSTRGQTRFLTCVARVTCLVLIMFSHCGFIELFPCAISSRLNVVYEGAMVYIVFFLLIFSLLSSMALLHSVLFSATPLLVLRRGPYPTTISFGRATGIDMLSHLPISTSMTNIASWCSPRPTTPIRTCSHRDLFTWVTSVLPISYTNVHHHANIAVHLAHAILKDRPWVQQRIMYPFHRSLILPTPSPSSYPSRSHLVVGSLRQTQFSSS